MNEDLDGDGKVSGIEKLCFWCLAGAIAFVFGVNLI